MKEEFHCTATNFARMLATMFLTASSSTGSIVPLFFNDLKRWMRGSFDIMIILFGNEHLLFSFSEHYVAWK